MFAHNHGAVVDSTNIGVLFALISILYIIAVFISVRKQRWKKVDFLRVFLFMIGVICSAFAVVGPIAERAHVDFTIHMIGHLLLGMLGPLLMVLGAPMTFVLRALPVSWARQLTRLLKSRLASICQSSDYSLSSQYWWVMGTLHDTFICSHA